MKITLNISDGCVAKVVTSNFPVGYHQLNDGDSINLSAGLGQIVIITEPIKVSGEPMSSSSESSASGALSFA